MHWRFTKGAFLAEYLHKGHRIGVAGCNAAGLLMKYRARLVPAAPEQVNELKETTA